MIRPIDRPPTIPFKNKLIDKHKTFASYLYDKIEAEKRLEFNRRANIQCPIKQTIL